MNSVCTSDDIRLNLTHLPVEESARLLLGCQLVTPQCRARIIEVEAYWDERDPGSHGWRGPTPRNQVMYGEPGRCYIYFNYGNHWLLNVVARPRGEAAAVLIRSAEPLEGTDAMWERRPKAKQLTDLLSGPGKLTQALGICPNTNGRDLLDPRSPVWIEPGQTPPNIVVTTRVGLNENRGASTPWRFIDADKSEFASRPHPPKG